MDDAHFLAEISDAYFAKAEKIVLVQDNLTTHMPKHGSWLNRAGAELSVLSRQCLKERVDSSGRVDG